MRLQRITPVEVRAEPGDDAHITLLGGGDQVSCEVPAIEKLTLLVKGNLGGVKSNNSGDGSEDYVAFETGPVIGPLFDIEHGWIVLRDIDLAGAADLLVPG